MAGDLLPVARLDELEPDPAGATVPALDVQHLNRARLPTPSGKERAPPFRDRHSWRMGRGDIQDSATGLARAAVAAIASSFSPISGSISSSGTWSASWYSCPLRIRLGRLIFPK